MANPYVDEYAPPPPDWHPGHRGDPPGHWSTACAAGCPQFGDKPPGSPADDKERP